jgi:hypothetical protein
MPGRSVLLSAIAMLFLGQPAWAADPVAVLCEIRIGQGEVWVQHAGTSDWMPPRPLLALHAGDQVRAEADGQAVLIFTGGGTQTVVSANSRILSRLQSPRAAGRTSVRSSGVSRSFSSGRESLPPIGPSPSGALSNLSSCRRGRRNSCLGR